MEKFTAIQQLNPTIVKMVGDTCYDINDNEVSYDESAVQSLIDSKEYINNRLNNYPSIGDQLDMIFRAGLGGDEFQAAIQAVKDDNPKPTE